MAQLAQIRITIMKWQGGGNGTAFRNTGMEDLLLSQVITDHDFYLYICLHYKLLTLST